jgi:hypothetical protein
MEVTACAFLPLARLAVENHEEGETHWGLLEPMLEWLVFHGFSFNGSS